ncbi:MAG TPA: TRL domain-containing protein [Leptospiraceae bacterium]|nr:TRL domain-containing protein [Leptospiraceae bacterium]
MKKYFITIVLSILFFSSCSSPAGGIFFTNTVQNVHSDGLQGQISSASVLKSGKSCSLSGLPVSLFYYGAGNSIDEAKKNGDISKIALIDRESVTVFFFFYRECIVVWGE